MDCASHAINRVRVVVALTAFSLVLVAAAALGGTLPSADGTVLQRERIEIPGPETPPLLLEEITTAVGGKRQLRPEYRFLNDVRIERILYWRDPGLRARTAGAR